MTELMMTIITITMTTTISGMSTEQPEVRRLVDSLARLMKPLLDQHIPQTLAPAFSGTLCYPSTSLYLSCFLLLLSLFLFLLLSLFLPTTLSLLLPQLFSPPPSLLLLFSSSSSFFLPFLPFTSHLSLISLSILVNSL